VTVRVTVNEIGRVAEVRRPDAPPLVFPAAPATTEQLVAAVEALLEGTANAVRQWQYDAPANPPVSFNVTVAFTPSAEPLLVSQAAAPAPTRPGPVFGGGLPEPEDPAWAEGAVRLGGQEPLPRRTRYVSPRYPTEARDRRVQGVVLIAARIGEDGRVTKARVLRSIPELDEAALDAVSQWEFTPTRLNGQPIPVVITVAVSFSL
jgi:TonB family protein